MIRKPYTRRSVTSRPKASTPCFFGQSRRADLLQAFDATAPLTSPHPLVSKPLSSKTPDQRSAGTERDSCANRGLHHQICEWTKTKSAINPTALQASATKALKPNMPPSAIIRSRAEGVLSKCRARSDVGLRETWFARTEVHGGPDEVKDLRDWTEMRTVSSRFGTWLDVPRLTTISTPLGVACSA